MKSLITLLFTLLLLPYGVGVSAQTFTSSPLPDSIFALMQGKSWREGCPVSRDDLRYLRVAHYDADGREQHGELVVNKAIANDVLTILRALHAARYPIERMTLIDHYDGDDERSMSANNSSCFCARAVTNGRTLSRHAYGMAVDINPLYNPYVKKLPSGKQLVAPRGGKSYLDRTKKSPYMIVKGDLCYRLFKKYGFSWGGDWRSCKDYQHFEKNHQP